MVGKNIKRLRGERGMTQEALAEKLHVTRQAVSSWENEKTRPDVETLGAIAQVLEVSVEELIYGRERKSAVDKTVSVTIDGGTSVGAALAAVLSYLKWSSIPWAILHGVLGWIYILYYVIKY